MECCAKAIEEVRKMTERVTDYGESTSTHRIAKWKKKSANGYTNAVY